MGNSGIWKLLKYSLEAECVTSKYIAGTSIQSRRIFGHQGIKALPRCKPSSLSTCPPSTPSTLRPLGILYGSRLRVPVVVYGRHVRACELPTYVGPFSLPTLVHLQCTAVGSS